MEHSRVECAGNEVIFHSPSDLQFTLETAARTLAPLCEQALGRRVRVRVTLADQTNPPENVAPARRHSAASPEAGEAANRAMADPQVQRFLTAFGGQVREVRDLKET